VANSSLPPSDVIIQKCAHVSVIKSGVIDITHSSHDETRLLLRPFSISTRQKRTVGGLFQHVDLVQGHVNPSISRIYVYREDFILHFFLIPFYIRSRVFFGRQGLK
jgi:hypothetical protein